MNLCNRFRCAHLPFILLLAVIRAHADLPLTVIHSFEKVLSYGINPSRLALGADGALYGTTEAFGTNTTSIVFRLSTNGLIKILHTFTNSDSPKGGLVKARDGQFYGTTSEGGDFGFGSVFRVDTNGQFITLYSFTGDTDGSSPDGGLFEGTDGNLYGVTTFGGDRFHSAGDGTIFQVTPLGLLSTLHIFKAGFDGSGPQGRLVQGFNGALYGTTFSGGNFSFGTVFEFRAGTLTVLHSFNGEAEDTGTLGGVVIGRDGNLYGTTTGRHAEITDYGTVFRLTPGGSFATLHVFDGDNGEAPAPELMLARDGSLFGMTHAGGTNFSGTIFRVGTNGIVTTLYSFNETFVDGGAPKHALVEASDGTLYGSTSGGGLFFENGLVYTGAGTVFRFRTNGVYRTLHTFNPTTGCVGGLVQGSDGYLYGATVGGGLNHDGTIFKVTTNGSFSTLASFNRTNGANPVAGLVQGRTGDFYGTTAGGGEHAGGTVFRMRPDGALNTLVSFAGMNGYIPAAQLSEGIDGTLYGTTAYGGSVPFGANNGTIFKMQTNGLLNPLIALTFLNGRSPVSQLIQGRDGLLYGTTLFGGIEDSGTVFKITTNGLMTTLISFRGTNGAYPRAGLIQGTDGRFYGTTVLGGFDDQGTVFAITTNGVLATLYSFRDFDIGGEKPVGGLVEGGDGRLYGTAFQGGESGYGTIFAIPKTGVPDGMFLDPVYSFTGETDGAHPVATLVLGTDGDLYGATLYGTTNSNGAIFRLHIPPVPRIMRVSHRFEESVKEVSISWTSEPGQLYQLQVADWLDQPNWWDFTSPMEATDTVTTFTDSPVSDVPGAQRFYRVLRLD